MASFAIYYGDTDALVRSGGKENSLFWKAPVAQWVNDSPITHGLTSTRSKRPWNWVSNCPFPSNTSHKETASTHLICFRPSPGNRKQSRSVIKAQARLPSPQSSLHCLPHTPSSNTTFWFFWKFPLALSSTDWPNTHRPHWKCKKTGPIGGNS